MCGLLRDHNISLYNNDHGLLHLLQAAQMQLAESGGLPSKGST